MRTDQAILTFSKAISPDKQAIRGKLLDSCVYHPNRVQQNFKSIKLVKFSLGEIKKVAVMV